MPVAARKRAIRVMRRPEFQSHNRELGKRLTKTATEPFDRFCRKSWVTAEQRHAQHESQPANE
jgi:hypothetical protein